LPKSILGHQILLPDAPSLEEKVKKGTEKKKEILLRGILS